MKIMKRFNAWQFGLDFIKGKDGKIYLIEINNDSTIALPAIGSKGVCIFDDSIKGIDNDVYCAKDYVKNLVPYCKKMRVDSVQFKYWWDTPNNGNMKETVEKGLAEHGITVKIGGQLSIYCYRDYVTKQNTDWFSRNKELYKKNCNIFEKVGITTIADMGKYDENSNYPTFVVKPTFGGGGKGVEFYKQAEKIEKKDYITEKYIMGETVTETLNSINGKLVLKRHNPRLCDYRSFVLGDEFGNSTYVRGQRRTSGIDLPDHLPDGKVVGEYYDAYLCNTSAVAVRNILTDEDIAFWKEIGERVGKVILKEWIRP